jgi:hypothetical protein
LKDGEGGVWNQQLCGSSLKYRSGVIQANNCEGSFWHFTLYEHPASINSKQESIKFQHDTFAKTFVLHQLIQFMLRTGNLINASFSENSQHKVTQIHFIHNENYR